MLNATWHSFYIFPTNLAIVCNCGFETISIVLEEISLPPSHSHLPAIECHSSFWCHQWLASPWESAISAEKHLAMLTSYTRVQAKSFSWPGLLWVILHCPLDLPQVRPFSLAAFSAWMASSKAPTRSHVYKVDQMASSSFSKSINLGQRFKAEVKSKHFFKNWLESTGNLHEVQITPISLGFWPRFKFIQFKTSPSQLGIVRTFLVAWILAKFAARVSALHKLDLEGYICKVESYVTMCILFWPRGRHVCTTSEASKAALSQKRMLALAKKTCIYMCIYIYGCYSFICAYVYVYTYGEMHIYITH